MTTIYGATVPNTKDNADASWLTIGTYFTPTVSGTITHAKWYFPINDPGQGAQVVFRLWRNSDQSNQGEVSFPLGATLDAVNQVAFPTPVAVQAGVQYCASVRIRRYPSSNGYFNSPVTSGELEMPSAAGRFIESPSGFVFPNGAFANTAYFVDVVFQPNGAATPVSSSITGRFRVSERITSTIGARFQVAQQVMSSIRGRFGVTTTPPPTPTVSTAVQRAQRAATAAFIRDDPTTASLIPVTRAKTPSGGFTEQPGLPRPSQTFKLSLLAYDTQPTITVAGVERIISYHLIGPHDMQIAVGDYWIDEDDTRWDVVGFTEGWGYMVKALISRHVPRGAVA